MTYDIRYLALDPGQLTPAEAAALAGENDRARPQWLPVVILKDKSGQQLLTAQWHEIPWVQSGRKRDLGIPISVESPDDLCLLAPPWVAGVWVSDDPNNDNFALVKTTERVAGGVSFYEVEGERGVGAYCPNVDCMTDLSAAVITSGPVRPPQDGDVSVCHKCFSYLRYVETEPGQLRLDQLRLEFVDQEQQDSLRRARLTLVLNAVLELKVASHEINVRLTRIEDLLGELLVGGPQDTLIPNDQNDED